VAFETYAKEGKLDDDLAVAPIILATVGSVAARSADGLS